jgi:nucleotide-binding universal stress UspA family protein
MDRIADSLRGDGVDVRTSITGSGPPRRIRAVTLEEHIDLIVLTTHGRGGLERVDRVKLGSVADRVVAEASCPVLLVPTRE